MYLKSYVVLFLAMISLSSCNGQDDFSYVNQNYSIDTLAKILKIKKHVTDYGGVLHFDKKGNLVLTEGGNQSTSFFYDGNDNLIKSIEIELPNDTLGIKEWKYDGKKLIKELHISRDKDTIYSLERKFNKNLLIEETELTVKIEKKDIESFIPLERQYRINTKKYFENGQLHTDSVISMSFMSDKEYEYRNVVSMNSYSKEKPIYYKISSGVKFKPSKAWVYKWREDGLPLIRGTLKYEYNSCDELIKLTDNGKTIYTAKFDTDCNILNENIQDYRKGFFENLNIKYELCKECVFVPLEVSYLYDSQKRLIQKKQVALSKEEFDFYSEEWEYGKNGKLKKAIAYYEGYKLFRADNKPKVIVNQDYYKYENDRKVLHLKIQDNDVTSVTGWEYTDTSSILINYYNPYYNTIFKNLETEVIIDSLEKNLVDISFWKIDDIREVNKDSTYIGEKTLKKDGKFLYEEKTYFDKSGRLILETKVKPISIAGQDGFSEYKVTYKYHANGKVLQEQETRIFYFDNNGEKILVPSKSVTTIKYNSYGKKLFRERVTSSVDDINSIASKEIEEYEYLSDTLLLLEKVTQDNIVILLENRKYNDNNQLLEVTAKYYSPHDNVRATKSEYYEYDRKGMLIQYQIESTHGKNEKKTWTYEYYD